MRWFFSAIWLVYLIQPVADLFGHRHGVAWIAGGLAITVAFCVIYMLVLMYSDEQPRLGRYGLVAIAVLAALACAVYGKDWTTLWIYVSAATGLVLAAAPDGRRAATLGVAGVGACYVFFCWVSHETLENSLIVLLPVLLIGLAMMGFRMQMTLMHELAQARGTVAKLAANEERLRLARDMHDLTGQSLSMITLKSELAAKRLAKLPSSAERDAVLTELGDIGRVSRQTLHDIREAVSGYRRPTLAIEAITARNALEAAGIGLDDDAELTLRSGTFDPDAEAVLAWCLREAVTNVIRHSRARHCRIRLAGHMGELSLEVTDDGHGFADQDPDHPQGQRLARHVRAPVRHRRPPVARPGRARPGRAQPEWPQRPRRPRLPPRRDRSRVAPWPRPAIIAAYDGGRNPGEQGAGPAAARRGPGDDQAGAGRAAGVRGRIRGRGPGRPGRRGPQAAARQTHPDVAVLDIEMPGMDGLTAAAALKKHHPDTKIVILTTFGRPGFLRRAMESGVSAFLVKDSPADKLTQTIRRVLAGERVIDPDLAAAALADGVNPLTPRERDVLEASADGRTIAEIAAQLYLSEGTVRNYLSACIQKTGARNRAEALRIASERGWLVDHRMKCVTSSGYLRYPHIHGDLVAFAAEDDIWLAPADGGRAWRLSTDRAQVSYPRFSRDGTRVAWTSWRDGNPEVYTADAEGNDAGRLTYWSDAEDPRDRLDQGGRGPRRLRHRSARDVPDLGVRGPARGLAAPAAAVRPGGRPGPGGARVPRCSPAG